MALLLKVVFSPEELRRHEPLPTRATKILLAPGRKSNWRSTRPKVPWPRHYLAPPPLLLLHWLVLPRWRRRFVVVAPRCCCCWPRTQGLVWVGVVEQNRTEQANRVGKGDVINNCCGRHFITYLHTSYAQTTGTFTFFFIDRTIHIFILSTGRLPCVSFVRSFVRELTLRLRN